MKKLFVLFILVFACLTVAAPSVHAQEMTKVETPVATEPAYMLAYPGILADNPLYKLKVLRDKLWIAITQNPVKKAQLYLLFADKQIAMAKALAQKNEFTLARDIALKGENQMTELTFFYKSSITKPDAAFYATLLRASKKHQEVLGEIGQLAPQNQKDIFNTIVEFSKRNEEEFGFIEQSE